MSLETIKNLKSWTGGMEVEYEAVKQLRNIAALPILVGHVAVMPDVHMGKGATVGSVIPTKAAVIPAAVGVDIGCGMCAVKTSLKAGDLPDSLTDVRLRIEAAVPVGFNAHDKLPRFSREGLIGLSLERKTSELQARYEKLRIMEQIGKHDHRRTFNQMGTLGGGNHFIELCLDEEGCVWIMLHSGSRNIGKTIGETAINMAKEVAAKVDRWLPDRDLAWLDEGSAEFDVYIEAMHWAQEYAAHNRDRMLFAVTKVLSEVFGRDIALRETAVNCHHNFTQAEVHFGQKVWVTRKGAVSAQSGQLGIIPGSMGDKSYIVRGKGNLDAYCSCSHGAGRRMSRGEAKRRFSLTDLVNQTAGAYKRIDEVMAAQADLVEVVHTLKQVMCIKG